jgi:hypothetical protein
MSEVTALVPTAAITPIDATESLALEEAVRAAVPRLRDAGRLKRELFHGVDEALNSLSAGLGDLASEGIWELHGGVGAGFFTGVEHRVLVAWLAAGHDGFSVVKPQLESGLIVDQVRGDPWEGSFVEIESW